MSTATVRILANPISPTIMMSKQPRLCKNTINYHSIRINNQYVISRKSSSANFNYGGFSIWKTLTNVSTRRGFIPCFGLILLNNLLVSLQYTQL
ncbi:hypothetical protein DERF_005033 [Dermatophagoides farinae]|uniref:Uncharacterized protein n=1 Tax=Dermatophagoides farinae TaxID=6954 RepID=A0A922I7C5_DERFA|nr:hypothetical protein DERF_005033 [Dermatophagoides farinae]